MNGPQILSRPLGGDEFSGDPRASTTPGISVTVPYASGAVGEAGVQIFHSNDDEDRGGVVIRFTTKDGGCSCVPLAVHHADGLELHLAGEVEARAFLAALSGLLASHQSVGTKPGVGT